MRDGQIRRRGELPERRLFGSYDIDGLHTEAALIGSGAEAIEIPWQDGARLINECAYLFATDVRELEELTLGLTLVEAKSQAPITSTEHAEPLARLKLGGKPVEHDETCRVFELVFPRKHLISYTVLNETYSRYPQVPEVFTGKLFRIFSRSYLLEFIERTTYASGGHPAPLMHIQIVCQNHVFDVITTTPPEIAVSNTNAPDVLVN
jgi:hypothetical protein